MSKTSKYLLMIGIYLFLSLLFLIGIECGLRAFGYGVDLDHLFLQTANGKYLYLNKNISRRYFTQSQATNGNVQSAKPPVHLFKTKRFYFEVLFQNEASLLEQNQTAFKWTSNPI